MILSSHKLDLVRPIPKEAIFGWAKNPKKKKKKAMEKREENTWNSNGFTWDEEGKEVLPETEAPTSFPTTNSYTAPTSELSRKDVVFSLPSEMSFFW